MERNIGAQNRRIPKDVQVKGSTARDLEHIDEDAPFESAPEERPKAASTVNDPGRDRSDK
jgi:hypothetical protein